MYSCHQSSTCITRSTVFSDPRRLVTHVTGSASRSPRGRCYFGANRLRNAGRVYGSALPLPNRWIVGGTGGGLLAVELIMQSVVELGNKTEEGLALALTLPWLMPLDSDFRSCWSAVEAELSLYVQRA